MGSTIDIDTHVKRENKTETTFSIICRETNDKHHKIKKNTCTCWIVYLLRHAYRRWPSNATLKIQPDLRCWTWTLTIHGSVDRWNHNKIMCANSQPIPPMSSIEFSINHIFDGLLVYLDFRLIHSSMGITGRSEALMHEYFGNWWKFTLIEIQIPEP